jgi:hypothetical protein
MRKILAVLLSVQLLVPVASARTIHDWSNLEKLELDDPLLVVLQTGEKIRGHFIRISEETLSLGVSVPSQFGATYLREIVRADIRKIELVRRAQNLPNPRTWVIGGALAEFRERYNRRWIVQRLGYLTPAQARQKLLALGAAA